MDGSPNFKNDARLMKNRSNLFRAILLLASGCFAPAATITWTNTSGGNWSAANNWTPHQVPGPADEVVITNNGTYTVNMDVDAAIASLTLGGASGTNTLSA